MTQIPETSTTPPPVASLNYTHPLEQWMQKDWARFVLRKLTAERPGKAGPHLLRALQTYGDPRASLHERVLYWPIHYALHRMKGNTSTEKLREKLAGHPPTLRGIIATARSVAKYGLTTPQRWINPLFAVWNFTNHCDLRCKHCYQSSGASGNGDELTLAEKLEVIHQLGKNYVAMIAFAGGEPTLSPHLEPALKLCKDYGMHTSIATHGGLLTPERCAGLADAGLKYVEISLDYVSPEKHDQFRGVPGLWKKSIQGIQNVVATPGLRAGLAMCVHQDNYDQVNDMIQMAVDMGVSCFAHFNFIPVGRGKEMAEKDITPSQREELLKLLHRWMESKKIGVISTAPQFGRICLTHSGQDGLVSCSHAGNAAGTKARVVAKYLGGCGAGRTYVCIQPNGEVTPCVYMPARVMGSIREKTITDIFQNNPWWDLFCDRDERQGTCGACDYRCYCGGCRARADAYFQRIDHSDPGCLNNNDLWKQIRESQTAETTTVQKTASPQDVFKPFVENES